LRLLLSFANANVMARLDRTHGARLLKAFLREHAITLGKASIDLGVSGPTVFEWSQGTKRPRTHHRQAIDIWTQGEVPASAWLDEAEVAAVAHVRPFKPAA